jgi:hypothetical protein
MFLKILNNRTAGQFLMTRPCFNCDGWSDTASVLKVEPFVEEQGPVHAVDGSAGPFYSFSLIS